MTIDEALDIVRYCPEEGPDAKSESCKNCPLIEEDDGGYAHLSACDHIRACIDIINDITF